jgi:hypothetical protein
MRQPVSAVTQYFGVYVLGVGLLHFARCGSASVLCYFVKYEKMQQQGSTCVSGTDFVTFLMSRARTDIHTRPVLTAIHTISYCKIQTAQRVGDGRAAVSTVCDKSETIQRPSFKI